MLDKLFLLLHLNLLPFAANEKSVLMFSAKQKRKEKVRPSRIYLERLAAVGSQPELRLRSNWMWLWRGEIAVWSFPRGEKERSEDAPDLAIFQAEVSLAHTSCRVRHPHPVRQWGGACAENFWLPQQWPFVKGVYNICWDWCFSALGLAWGRDLDMVRNVHSTLSRAIWH